MKIYYSESGAPVHSILFAHMGGLFIAYDSHTNPTLYSDVCANPTAYLVVDGVLTRDGVPVPINPPCSDCQVLDAVVGDVPATVEQLQAAVRLLILKPGFQRG